MLSYRTSVDACILQLNSIDGTFLSTCQNVMRVLRENVDSVLAVLEAFAHDPLIDWFVKVRQRKWIGFVQLDTCENACILRSNSHAPDPIDIVPEPHVG